MKFLFKNLSAGFAPEIGARGSAEKVGASCPQTNHSRVRHFPRNPDAAVWLWEIDGYPQSMNSTRAAVAARDDQPLAGGA
jgi:hypothetical protein